MLKKETKITIFIDIFLINVVMFMGLWLCKYLVANNAFLIAQYININETIL